MKTGKYFHKHCNALRLLDLCLLFSLWVIAILDHPAQLTPPQVIGFGHIHFLASLASTENMAKKQQFLEICKFREYALNIMFCYAASFLDALASLDFTLVSQ